MILAQIQVQQLLMDGYCDKVQGKRSKRKAFRELHTAKGEGS